MATRTVHITLKFKSGYENVDDVETTNIPDSMEEWFETWCENAGVEPISVTMEEYAPDDDEGGGDDSEELKEEGVQG